jgi:hypothetical protein
MRALECLRGSTTILFFGLVIGEPALYADSLMLIPVADTTLQEAFPNNNFGDGTTCTAGTRRRGGRTRMLLRFDIADSIPAGSTIDSVTLTLRVTSTPSGGANSMFDINRVLVSWGEGNGSDHGGTVGGSGQATWNNRTGPGTAWTTAGGDFSPTASASRSIAGNGSYLFGSTPNMINDAQAWLDNPAINFGWILRTQSEGTFTTIRRFAARTDLANAPMLTIQFTPIPEPGSMALVGLGALILGVCGWRQRAARLR